MENDKKIEIVHLDDQEFDFSSIEPRYGHTSLRIENKIYFFGGLNLERTKFFNDILVFDIKEKKFVDNFKPEEKQKIAGRHFHSSIFDKDASKIISFGGKSNGYLANVLVFSISTKKFESYEASEMKGDIPSPRYGHSSAFFEGKMYIFGGYNISGFDCNEIYEFSLDKLEWRKIKTDIPRRYLFGSISFKVSETKMDWYIIHGISKRLKSLNDIWKIEMNKNKNNEVVITTKKLKIKKKAFEKNQKNYGQAIFSIGNSVYCYGRRDEKQSFMYFDRTKKEIIWKNLNFPFIDSSFYSYGTINQIDKKIYLFGGLKIENAKKLIKISKENLEKKKKFFNASDNLPDDTIRIILSFLDTKDLCSITEVSKKWSFSIIAGTNYFWDAIFEDNCKKFLQDSAESQKKKLVKIQSSKTKTYKILKSNFKLDAVKIRKYLSEHLKSVEYFHFNTKFNPMLLEKNYKPGNSYFSKSVKDTIFYGEKSTKKDCKVVVLGDGAVGKTCMLISYAHNSFPDDYVPTVFDNYSATTQFGKEMVNLQLWDTAGEEDYDRLRPLSYPGTDVFLCSYSVIDPTSLENIKKKWLPELRSFFPGTPVVLVGTKLDLKKDERVIRELKERGMKPVEQKDIEAIVKDAPDVMFWIENSAKTQKNIKDTFHLIMCAWLIKKKGMSFFMGDNKSKCAIM